MKTIAIILSCAFIAPFAFAQTGTTRETTITTTQTVATLDSTHVMAVNAFAPGNASNAASPNCHSLSEHGIWLMPGFPIATIALGEAAVCREADIGQPGRGTPGRSVA